MSIHSSSADDGRASLVAYFVDEEDAWDKLCYALVDVPINHLVDFQSQLLCYFSLPRLRQLTEHRGEIAPALGARICCVQVVKRDILYDTGARNRD